MAQVQQIPDIRARSVGEMADASIKVWTNNFKKLFATAFWVTLPFQVFAVGAQYSVRPTLRESLEKWQTEFAETRATGVIPSFPKFSQAQIGAASVSFLFSFVSGLILTAALTSFLSDYVAARGTPNPADTRRRTIRRSPVVLLTTLITLAAVLLPLIVVGLVARATNEVGVIGFSFPLFPLCLFIAVRFQVSAPVAVLEPVGAFTAIKRSWGLTRGRLESAFGLTILSALIVVIPAGIVSGILLVSLRALGGNNPDFLPIWEGTAAIAANALFAPLGAAMRTFLYYDLRVRREGFDMQRLSAELGRRTPPGGGFDSSNFAGQDFPPTFPGYTGFPPGNPSSPPPPNPQNPAPPTDAAQSDQNPPESKWF